MNEHDQMIRDLEKAWSEIAALTAERDELKAVLADEQKRFGYFETEKLQEVWAKLAKRDAEIERLRSDLDKLIVQNGKLFDELRVALGGEGKLPLSVEVQELRDQKMALLLVVDDAHRIMGERQDKIDAQDNVLRAINESLAGLEMPVGDRAVMIANVRKIVAEVDDWRESARKAAEEPCGDEKHCPCVGLLRHMVVRQQQGIIELDGEYHDLREAVAELIASEGSSGTFDAFVLRAAIERCKEILEGG